MMFTGAHGRKKKQMEVQVVKNLEIPAAINMVSIHDTKVEVHQVEWYQETVPSQVVITVTYTRHRRIPLIYLGKIQKKTHTPTHIAKPRLSIEEQIHEVSQIGEVPLSTIKLTKLMVTGLWQNFFVSQPFVPTVICFFGDLANKDINA